VASTTTTTTLGGSGLGCSTLHLRCRFPEALLEEVLQEVLPAAVVAVLLPVQMRVKDQLLGSALC
jgi:hypothetical protein